MQRCPCCNARLKEAVNCPRCKADLAQIIRAQKWAERWHQKAIACYLNDEIQNCLDALTRSLNLQHSESAFLFRAFVIKQQEQNTEFVKLQRILQETIHHSTILLKRFIDTLSYRFFTIYQGYKKQ